jgi:poly(A)-specific ribonuclease
LFQNKAKPQNLSLIKAELDLVVFQLQTKGHLIVGHNLFMDLGFLYKTFIGPLPKNVQDFCKKINELFPMVVDTKYMATMNTGPMGPRHNLKELLTPFQKIHTPLIVLDEKHTLYGASFGKEHEAGFDSWMTAELFIKLSAKLFLDRRDEYRLTRPVSRDYSYDYATGGVKLFPISSESHEGDNNTSPEWHSHKLIGIATNGTINVIETSKPSKWIPPLNHDFWLAYANKLRVNQAEVGVCDLGEGP